MWPLFAVASLLVFSTPSEQINLVAPCDDTHCVGIRPGALVSTPGSSDCTAAFVLVSANETFITIPAHCVEDVGQKSWFWYRNASTDGRSVGVRPADAEVAFVHPLHKDNNTDATQFWDIALLRILPEAVADVVPDVCHWGGPTAVMTRPPPVDDAAFLYGHGLGFHERAEARLGTRVVFEEERMFFVTTAATVGDSGGPWLGEGLEAIGYETRTAVGGFDRGTDKGIRLEFALNEYRRYGFDLKLLLAGERPPVPSMADADAEVLSAREVPALDLVGGLLAVAVVALHLRTRRA